MRQITSDAARAFKDARSFSRSNTQVVVNRFIPEKPVVEMYLHGNLIARQETGSSILQISHCGWETVTTKERLNGIIPRAMCIFQKNWEWYIRGSDGVPHKWSNVVRFTNYVYINTLDATIKRV